MEGRRRPLSPARRRRNSTMARAAAIPRIRVSSFACLDVIIATPYSIATFFDYLRTCRRSLADCKKRTVETLSTFYPKPLSVYSLAAGAVVARPHACICARGHSCVATTLGDARKAFAAASSEQFVSPSPSGKT